MRAWAWSLVGVGFGFWAVLLLFDVTGDLQNARNFILGGCICWAISATLFFISDYQRKRRPKPL